MFCSELKSIQHILTITNNHLVYTSLFKILYQGLHIGFEKVTPDATGWLATSSVEEAWFCSESVSSRSELRSSVEVLEVTGDTTVLYILSGRGQVLLQAGLFSSRCSSSLRGILSRRWFSSSDAMAGSIPGQQDTNVCTSCMHWM